MNKEIERKFLVKGDFKEFSTSSSNISQGYLSSIPERTVRIRIKGDQGFITIKGASNESGLSRYEWEKEISYEEAMELLRLAEPGSVEKIRYIIPTNEGLNFEVDEFLGDNKGLVMAEIELPAEETTFNKPDWLGKEVTGNVKYYNSYLSKNPYKAW